MTQMHGAAIAPQQPTASAKERAHPLYTAWRQHVSFCSINLIQASRFDDWLYQRNAEAIRSNAATHPDYPQFLAWMRETKAGARKCPAGIFPSNFHFWRDGGRW